MPSSHESLLCQYRYDVLDRLIGHTPANEAQHQRFYCKSRLATEIQGAFRTIVQHGNLLLAQQQKSGKTLDTTLLATDQQRSVLRVVSEAEQQQNSIAYSPYGHRCAENGLLSLMGFNGERPDPVTGHYLLGNGYRAFNPALMRFNSTDNLSPFGRGGINSYTYCLGDPTNRYDQNGHYSIKSLATALLTRKVKTLNGLYYVKIKKDVKIVDALRARDGLKDIDRRIALEYKTQNNIFDTDYANRFIPQQNMPSLKNLAHAKILEKGISDASVKALESARQAVPPGVKKILTNNNLHSPHSQFLEYLELRNNTPHTFNYVKLEHPNEQFKHLPAVKKYQEKLLSIRDPYLQIEIKRLTKQYFDSPFGSL